MTEDQMDRMEKGQKLLLRLMEEAAAGAREMCELGETDVSGDLWCAHGHLAIAYGIMRKCRGNDDLPVARSGGK